MMGETLALFGTSADPPTIGHRAVIAYLSEQFDRVLVWAVDNPFKAGQISLEHRQNMLRILLETSGMTHSNVLWMPDLSDRRSLKSVVAVEAQWPEAELILVVGSDVLSMLLEWYCVDELIRKVRFLVIQRPGSAVNLETLHQIRQRGGKISVSEFEGPEVSSSDYRLHHQTGGLTPEILEYLTVHDLYSDCSPEIHA